MSERAHCWECGTENGPLVERIHDVWIEGQAVHIETVALCIRCIRADAVTGEQA